MLARNRRKTRELEKLKVGKRSPETERRKRPLTRTWRNTRELEKLRSRKEV